MACTVRSRHGEEIRPDVSVSGNVVRLTFNAEHTKNVQFSHADYDVQITLNGRVITICRGTVQIIKDITL